MHREPRRGVADLELADVAGACELVGDRWSLPVVAALLDGPLRYTELRGRLPAIAPNILAARLRSLEDDGLVVSSRYSERPPRAAYQLTAEGAELAGALRLLAHWGTRHTDQADAPRHLTCGTPIQARWYCPTCDQLVDHEPGHVQVHHL